MSVGIINLGVFGGLSDDKFISKIHPLIDLVIIDSVYLFRYKGNVFQEYQKVKAFSPANKNYTSKSRFSKVLFDAYNLWLFFRLCATNRINLLVGVYLYPHGLYASLLGRLFRIPYILILPGSDLKRYLKTKRFHSLFRKATFMGVRGSNSLQQLLRIGYDPEKVFVLPNVFDPKEYCHGRNASNKYDIVYTGYLRPQKRLDVMLEVIRLLKETGFPGIKCLIAGDGPFRKELETLVTDLDLQDNVDFIGYTKPIWKALEVSKVYMMTSDSEGLPMSIIEAMACGLPVIVSKVNDIPDVVEHNVNGFLVEPLNVAEFVACARKLLIDDSQVDSMGAAARAKIHTLYEESYSFEQVKKLWESIIKKVQYYTKPKKRESDYV